MDELDTFSEGALRTVSRAAGRHRAFLEYGDPELHDDVNVRLVFSPAVDAAAAEATTDAEFRTNLERRLRLEFAAIGLELWEPTAEYAGGPTFCVGRIRR